MLAGELGERLAGADFEQEQVSRFKGGIERLAEVDGVAELARPVGRIGEGGGVHGFAGAGGDPGDLRRSGGKFSGLFGERCDDGLHHRRVEGVRGFEDAALDFLRGELFLIEFNGFVRTGDGAELRAVDGGDFDAGRKRQVGGSLADGEHAAAGQFLHQAGAGCEQCERVFQREGAGDHGGDVFSDAVAYQK